MRRCLFLYHCTPLSTQLGCQFGKVGSWLAHSLLIACLHFCKEVQLRHLPWKGPGQLCLESHRCDGFSRLYSPHRQHLYGLWDATGEFALVRINGLDEYGHAHWRQVARFSRQSVVEGDTVQVQRHLPLCRWTEQFLDIHGPNARGKGLRLTRRYTPNVCSSTITRVLSPFYRKVFGIASMKRQLLPALTIQGRNENSSFLTMLRRVCTRSKCRKEPKSWPSPFRQS